MLSAATLLLLASAQGLTVTVDAKEGETVTGERTFRVTAVIPNDVVNQVEFYVGDELRDNDTSTPYQFRLDTLNENDGPLKLRFKAYTTEGKQAERVVTVNVDNGLSKGAPFHVERAIALLQDGKPQEALTAGRIALKADENSVPARLVLARANLALGVFDQAQRYAEDAISRDKENTQAYDLLAAAALRRSFNLVVREGGDRKATLEAIRAALKAGVEARRQALNISLDSRPATTPENTVANADIAIRAGRFGVAIADLQTALDSDVKNSAVANRLAYAQLRAGRREDALKTLTTHQRYVTPDGYGFALLAVIRDQNGDAAGSADALRQALLTGTDDLGVKTAQTYLALRNDRTNVLQSLLTDLAKDQGSRPEVSFYRFALANRLQRYEDARKFFNEAVLAEPASVDAYVERGNVALLGADRQTGTERDYALDTARTYYDTALVARPESAEALSGLVLVNLLGGKPDEAIRLGEAATRANPSTPAAHYALSAAYNRKANDLTRAAGGAGNPEVVRLSNAATASLRRAGQLDDRNLGGRSVPREADVVRYLTTSGRAAVIAPPR